VKTVETRQVRQSAGSIGLIQRAGWGVADQALSSLTNFALSIFVVRAVSVAEFGAFTIAFASYQVALALCRAIASEPLLIRYSASHASLWRRGTGLSTGAGLLLGVGSGLCFILAGWTMGGALRGPLVVLGLTLPGLLLQECWRYAFLARGKGFSAFINDLVWAVALFPALIALQGRQPSVTSLMLAWGGAANIAALVGVRQAQVVPTPRYVRNWLREQRDLFPKFVGEFGVDAGASQLIASGLAAIAGLAVLGVFRAGYILFGPIQVLVMGVGWVAVPELVRTLQRPTRRLLWTSASVSLGLGGAALVWGAMVLMVPTPVGTSLLGPAWTSAHRLSAAVTVAWVGAGVIAGAAAGLRALAAARASLAARLVGCTLSVASGLLGGAVNGAIGAAWGLALAGWIGAVVWWRKFARVLREREGTVAAEETGAARLVSGPSLVSQETSS